MRRTSLILALCSLTALPVVPAQAQNLGDIISGVAGAVINQELDRNTFAAAQRQNTVAAYRDYLSRFPSGAYRAHAERAILALQGTATPLPAPIDPAPVTPLPSTAASVEASVGLTRSDRIAIQQQLSRLGYDTGVADGLWGKNTRAAIARWQNANKLDNTGYLTRQQVTLIAQQAGTSTTPPPVGGATADDRVEEQLLGLTLAERRSVQIALTSLGYSTRGTDGVFGQNTRRALKAWQASKSERETGYLTADQLRLLRREAGI